MVTDTADKLSCFTRRARTALTLTKKLAVAERQTVILPDHLVQAILDDTTGDGVQLLIAAGVDPLRLRQQFNNRSMPRGKSPPPKPLLSPALKAVIAQAVSEAQQAQVGYISTRHMLHAVVAYGEGIGAATLREHDRNTT